MATSTTWIPVGAIARLTAVTIGRGPGPRAARASSRPSAGAQASAGPPTPGRASGSNTVPRPFTEGNTAPTANSVGAGFPNNRNVDQMKPGGDPGLTLRGVAMASALRPAAINLTRSGGVAEYVDT